MMGAPLHEVLAALAVGSDAERLLAAQRIEEFGRLIHAMYPALLAAARRGPSVVATHCLDAIGSIGFGQDRKQLLNGLESLMRSNRGEVRLASAMAIWRTTGMSRVALVEVRAALGTKSSGMARFALAALAEMGPQARGLTPFLRKLPGRMETPLQPWLSHALWRVEGKSRLPAKCMRSVLSDGTEGQRVQALLLLSSMPNVARLLTKVLTALAQGQNAGSEAVRVSAAEVLQIVRGGGRKGDSRRRQRPQA